MGIREGWQNIRGANAFIWAWAGKKAHAEMTYTIIVREKDGRLWITIPAAIRRSLGLRAGDTCRWRKQRGTDAHIITFFRRGQRILPRGKK